MPEAPMTVPRTERRLAAILAVDVVGYSRLVEQDEAGTLALLRTLREQALAPVLAAHQGRIAKLMGDGAIVEFASVVNAVAAAIALQEAMAQAQAAAPDERRIRLRIGVNLGDVVVEGEDLLGDGVNVAARLEQLCAPGGVLISGTAYDQLDGKLDVRLQFAGEQRLKNIDRPVRTYRLAGDGAAGGPAVTAGEIPTIAVLPFDNLSHDPTKSYFSDGIVEDIITELSRFRHLVVLARHSSFALRGQALGAVEIGRRLGVAYLLEGSVRCTGERVRITAQLIDARNGAHVWANRYDGAVEDIFAVQDEVVAKIAATLAGRITVADQARARRHHPADMRAYDHVLRGMERLADYGPEANAEARAWFARAVDLAPDYALAHAYHALAIFSEEWGADAEAKLAACLASARRAVALDAADSRCQRILAIILLTARAFAQADSHAQRSLALNPNDSSACATRAYILIFLGRPAEALPVIQRAMALDPFHPPWYQFILALAFHDLGQHAEAVTAFERIDQPRFHHLARLAACHTRLGQTEAARRCVERVLSLKPDFSARAWAEKLPYQHAADAERLHGELIAAGLPA
ncbi:MAG: adenylate/guanylate cyclase domain-containing protein [Geminicoccaceae bacterium]